MCEYIRACVVGYVHVFACVSVCVCVCAGVCVHVHAWFCGNVRHRATAKQNRAPFWHTERLSWAPQQPTHTLTHRHTYTHTHAHTEMPALFCTFRIDLMSMFAAHKCALV